MSGSLEAFFRRYGNLSLSDAADELAAQYGPSFIVASPLGSMAFANDDRFRSWLRQVGEFNRGHGMRGMAVVSVQALELSPIHTLATVRWGAQFEKTGDRLIEFDIAYLLERAGETWTILAYVSKEDQDEAMRREGLLS